MTVDAFSQSLLEILDKGVYLEPDGDVLHVNAPRGALKLDDISFLISCKAEIIALLLDLRRQRLTDHDFGDHLLEQAQKAHQSARQAKASGCLPLFWQEWERGSRLSLAGLEVISKLHHETENSCMHQQNQPTSIYPITGEK